MCYLLKQNRNLKKNYKSYMLQSKLKNIENKNYKLKK